MTPPSFTGLAVGEQFDVVDPDVPAAEGEQALRREIFEVSVVGRLRPDWTLERASAHVEALSTGMFEATAPGGYGAQGTNGSRRSGSPRTRWPRAWASCAIATTARSGCCSA